MTGIRIECIPGRYDDFVPGGGGIKRMIKAPLNAMLYLISYTVHKYVVECLSHHLSRNRSELQVLLCHTVRASNIYAKSMFYLSLYCTCVRFP